MSGNIVFASRDKLGLCKDNGLDYFESEYICKYQKNKLEISKKYEWKKKVLILFSGETFNIAD